MSENEKVKKVFGHLTSEVHSDLCAGCGACIASCPVDSLSLENGRPSLKGHCTACGLCYAVCPQTVSNEEIMGEVFGEVSSSEVGPYKEAYAGKTTSASIEVAAQDGGIVTSLLTSLLKDDFIDGAIVMGSDSEWRPQSKVAISEEDLIDCAGTKYTPGPLFVALQEGIDFYDLDRMAVVATPCQVKAIRHMAIGKRAVRKITDKVKLIIGLFCSRCFTYSGFFEKVLVDQLDIDLSNVGKFDVKEGKFIIYQKGKRKEELDLDSLDQFVFHPCKICRDFSAELADLSVGSAGSPRGQSTVIVRTDVGEEAFTRGMRSGIYEAEPLDEVDPGMEFVEKVSSQKKKRASKEIKTHKEKGKSLPPRLEE